MNWVGACQVPVFRYALERWNADPYLISVTPGGTGEFTEAEQAVFDFLKATQDDVEFATNILVKINDSPGESPKEARLELFYPDKIRGLEISPIWTASLTMENAKKIVDSPARREIVKRLLQGQSSTWVLVESGNAEVDDAAAGTMEEALKEATEILDLPEGVFTSDELDTLSDDASIDLENVLQSEIPLKIDFSLLRISRDDENEAAFLQMLLNLESDLGEFASEPMVFPVFGRGRVLEPLISKGVNKDNVVDYSGYLCGACSCEVKDENPGKDLLVTANWDVALDGSEIIIDKVLPPLEGLNELSNADANPTISAAGPITVESSPYQVWAIVAGGAVFFIVIASFVLKRKAS